MRGDEGVELAHELLVVSTEVEVCVDPPLERLQPKLLDTPALGSDERKLVEVREGRSALEGQCLPERRGCVLQRLLPRPLGEREEALEIELVRVEREHVARALRDDALGAQRLADAVHADLQRVPRGGGWILAPDGVDDPLARDDAVPRSGAGMRAASAGAVRPSASKPSAARTSSGPRILNSWRFKPSPPQSSSLSAS